MTSSGLQTNLSVQPCDPKQTYTRLPLSYPWGVVNIKKYKRNTGLNSICLYWTSRYLLCLNEASGLQVREHARWKDFLSPSHTAHGFCLRARTGWSLTLERRRRGWLQLNHNVSRLAASRLCNCCLTQCTLQSATSEASFSWPGNTYDVRQWLPHIDCMGKDACSLFTHYH